MTVYETEIPGVGRKFELELDGGTRAVVIHHHDGRREVFRRPSPDADSERVFDLGGEDARTLGSILEGAHFESVDVADLSVPLGDAIIEWRRVGEHSPLGGETLRDADVRGETGVSVIAVQRGEETVPNPGPEFVFEVGDVLVGLGTRRDHERLKSLLSPGE